MIDEHLSKAVLHLSVEDRIKLIDLIWTSLDPYQVPVTELDSVNVDIGLANLLNNPHETALWKEVMQFLKERTR